MTMGVASVIEKARAVVGDRRTYISVDVDGFDPAYEPVALTLQAYLRRTERDMRALLRTACNVRLVYGQRMPGDSRGKAGVSGPTFHSGATGGPMPFAGLARTLAMQGF